MAAGHGNDWRSTGFFEPVMHAFAHIELDLHHERDLEASAGKTERLIVALEVSRSSDHATPLLGN